MANPVHQTVIVGGGFAGLFTALHLRHQNYPRSVVLIDKGDRFCFKPLLYEYFSGEMDAYQVVPRYDELLSHSGAIFVQDTVESIDLQQKQVRTLGGDCYSYSNLVLALGSITGYFGVEGAKENGLPFRTQADAIALDRHLRDCLQRAAQIEDADRRRPLLTVAVIGAGPSGVEIAATLGDLLPQWYEALGGNPAEIRVLLVNHGLEILKGDINSDLQAAAETALQQRRVAVEMLLGAGVKAIHPNGFDCEKDGEVRTIATETVIWTAGTNTNPLIEKLPIPDEHRDKHGRLHVTPSLQLPDFPEVFAGGDCIVDLQPDASAKPQGEETASPNTELKPLPPTAQVAYQHGLAIANNLRALALGYPVRPAKVNLRGTLLKVGLEESIANIFNRVEVGGEIGHLIRQGTYLELLPTPLHDFKATTEWIEREILDRYSSNDLKDVPTSKF